MSKKTQNLSPFVNPYNFIPFYGKVEDERKSRETAYRGKDELKSGWLDVRMYVKTPVIIPNGAHPRYIDLVTGKEVKKPTEELKKKLHKEYSFMRIEKEGKEVLTVPGSELRGMIRAAYETATDSCLPFLLNDKPISQRVPTFGSLQRRGLLAKEVDPISGKKRWVLYQTVAEKVEVTVENNGFMKEKQSGRAVTATPGTIDSKKGVLQYNIPVDKKDKPYHIAYLQPTVVEFEWEVEDSEPFDKLKSALKRDNVPGKDNSNKIPRESLLKCLMRANENPETKVPVWYFYVVRNGKKKVYLSGSSIGRIGQVRKWKEIMGEYSPCTSTDKLCPACMLFGTTQGEGLKSHVRVTDAVLTEDSVGDTEIHTLEILGGPRTTAFEFYLRKPGNATYWNFDFYGEKKVLPNGKSITEYHDLKKATPRGRKMYWHFSPVADANEKNRMNQTMEAVKENNIFKFRIYFDQISQKQLEQLMWVLSLGENTKQSALQHKLGHAKPLGYGSVKLVIDSCTTRDIHFTDSFAVHMNCNDFIGTREISCPFDKDAIHIKSFLSMCDASTVQNETVMYPRLIKGKKEDDSIYQWFSENRKNANSLKTLPEPTDEKLSLIGSWKSEHDPRRRVDTNVNKAVQQENTYSSGTHTGTIEKVVSDKGFGFIKPRNEKNNLFFHISNLVGCSMDSLERGDPVSFDIGTGRKGPVAINVQKL